METGEIISSGLLELYAAGIASEQELRDVAQWIAMYPEVAAELKAINSATDSYADAHAILPSAVVKEKIFTSIRSIKNDNNTTPGTSSITGAKVIAISPFWKMAAAASVALLILSTGLNIVTYKRYNQANTQLVLSRQTLATLEAKNKTLEAGMDVVQSKYSVPVSLNGLEASPDAAAKIFWMKNTGEVFIDPSNLPATPQGKRYQLWAIVDGKPVDGGMIPAQVKGEKYQIQKMKSFGKVEAFAVTLETEEGNPTPKGPMYVLGKM